MNQNLDKPMCYTIKKLPLLKKNKNGGSSFVHTINVPKIWKSQLHEPR
jgi:hypothetical protein